MVTKKKKDTKKTEAKVFNRTVFIDLLSKLHQTLEDIEDTAIDLPKNEMYEIYLFMENLYQESKKMRTYVKETVTLFGVGS